MEIDFIVLIPFCLAIWLVVTTLIGFLSGWYSLMLRYSDRLNEIPVVKFSRESGYVGSVFGGMRGILNVSACRTGLRVGIMKFFGPFSEDFFVPWNEVSVKRRDFFFMKFAELTLGASYGKLGIDALVADRF